MAIDPYKPELAKRQTAFQIATKQLMDRLNQNIGLASQGKADFAENFNGTLEALRDYEQSGRELSEWISQKGS
ncbi:MULTISPECIES: hypothetical protein [Cyanophyceae]|jgi:hypothetical protein|uniref:hypothetical protein n=1 Tax=Cyanophyceae TaxID=3028117 RepID=UPI001687A005|nr:MULTISPECIES: hypothetical protein [Cyanophyceae]MBD1914286.1 hypothetical protein [Phormidium sp. FACHB-77]MBD2031221.1 hypothetical protein [Phormidium sp. FACHB-322]MBD2049620.1 hypothetical protein [Leptolyngbya sp. FACHB-60]MBW4462486.1 hypothetical protein [Nodosilinea sp. WJT8-NPBG4]